MEDVIAETTDSLVDRGTDIFARVFVPVDFTLSSHEAVGVALALRRSFGSELCLFHLVEEGGGDEFLGGLGDRSSVGDLVESAKGRLQRFIANIAPELVDLVEVRAYAHAKPIEDLRNEASRWGASLVLLATTFRGLFRSPAEKLVHGFDIPVLLIPAGMREQSVDVPGPVIRSQSTPGL